MSGRIIYGEFLVLSTFSHNQSNPTGLMQENATLAQQTSAAAPVAVPFLINRENVI